MEEANNNNIDIRTYQDGVTFEKLTTLQLKVILDFLSEKHNNQEPVYRNIPLPYDISELIDLFSMADYFMIEDLRNLVLEKII